MRGVVYIAVGSNATREASKSRDTLLQHNDLPYEIIETSPADLSTLPSLTADQRAHWLKVSIDLITPFGPTLLLDADTRIKGELQIGFDILDAGWDLVMVPSTPPYEGASLWNLSADEKRTTLDELGTWTHVMLNTGLLYFNNTVRVKSLFAAWRKEWLRFKDRDQGAFLRALKYNPVRVWLLGYPFNSAGGEVVDHLFGRAQ